MICIELDVCDTVCVSSLKRQFFDDFFDDDFFDDDFGLYLIGTVTAYVFVFSLTRFVTGFIFVTSLYIVPGPGIIVDDADRYLFDELIWLKSKYYNWLINFPFFTFRFLRSAAC